MSDGNGGSGGGDGVHGDGGARGAGPEEPQTLGCRAGPMPAPSPALAGPRVPGAAVGGVSAETGGLWRARGPPGPWHVAACCGCAAGGVGGGQRAGPGAGGGDGTHPDPRELPRCPGATWSAEGGSSHGICWPFPLRCPRCYLRYPWTFLWEI